jgi:hypothetical protein
MRGNGSALDVFSMAAGTVEIVLLPAVVDLLGNRIPWRLMILIA